jgi:transposase
VVVASWRFVPGIGFGDVSRLPEAEVRDLARLLIDRVSALERALGPVLAAERAARSAREAELERELAAERARADALAERVEWLSRRLGKDSSNSSRPPGSDGPYRGLREKPRREPSGRRPGKQPGAPSSTLGQVASPDERAECAPPECRGCGADLSAAPVVGEQRRQVFEARPAPPPLVTEFVVQARQCPCCGEVTEGAAPGGVTGRAQYGPRVHALAALLTSWHHVPVGRAARMLGQLAGVRASAGFTAGARGRAAALLAPFMDRARELLAGSPVLHADETPARAAGKVRYLHVASTGFLTAMHASDRTNAGIDAGRILPGYTGVLVRDGYSGYLHLAGAVHAWCGAHLLRDLKGISDRAARTWDNGPQRQQWTAAMAAVLHDALQSTRAARAREDGQLSDLEQARIRAAYRAALAGGIEANRGRKGMLATDALSLAMRFGRHEDMILRFITDLAIPFTNNQAERDLRPAKVQQHASGGHWRTLLGLADFAIVRSYLSTAAKWGIDPLDALTRLFTTGPWLPPALQPA